MPRVRFGAKVLGSVGLSIWMGVFAAAGEAEDGRSLTIRVEAAGEIPKMVEGLITSKLLKAADGYQLVAAADIDKLAANIAAMGEVPLEQARKDAAALANEGVDVLVHASAKVVGQAVRVSIEAKAIATGEQIALARQEVRGPVGKPGMPARLIERAVDLSMPSVLRGLRKHKQAGAPQGMISPINTEPTRSRKVPKAGKSR